MRTYTTSPSYKERKKTSRNGDCKFILFLRRRRRRKKKRSLILKYNKIIRDSEVLKIGPVLKNPSNLIAGGIPITNRFAEKSNHLFPINTFTSLSSLGIICKNERKWGN